jgi:predicted O-methyltransferase YrrM
MKNRIELAKHFEKLGFKVGAEVGVFNGYYSEVLCKTIPDLKLYAVDSWEVYKGYRDHKFTTSMQRAYDAAKKRLDPFSNCEIIKKFSMDAVKDFEDESLDFVFIDGNHAYKYVKEDIEEWSKKVKKSGIVSGHDYYITNSGNVGVIQAVDEYVKKNNYKLNLTDWDKTLPVKDDWQPCWFFTKI